MALEPSFDNIDDLNRLNPADNDPVEEGDDHLRGIKQALQGNVTGDATETRLVIADGGQVIAIAADGSFKVVGFVLSIDSEVDGAADVRILNTQGSVLLSQRNAAANGDFRIIEGDALGAFVQDWAHFNKGAGSIFLHANEPRIQTKANGADVIGQDLSVDNSLADQGTFMTTRNLIGGSGLSTAGGDGATVLTQRNSAGGFEKNILRGERDAATLVYFDGSIKIATSALGVDVLGTLANGTTGDADGEINFKDTADVRGAQIRQFNLSLRMTNRIAGGLLHLEALNAAATLRQLFQGDPDAACNMYFDGVQTLRTADPAVANSGGEVIDDGAIWRAIGFQTMPRSDVPAGTRTLAIGDAGKRFRMQSATSILQLGDIGNEAAVNVYVSTPTDTAAIRVPSGTTLRYYSGSGGQQDFAGLQDVALLGGAAVTLVQFSGAATTWEMWGGQLA